ncbi:MULTISPECIES: WXG100 family type VII secretion target [unclassified Saccharothrix]|uniref:WXG100 family type VII secretion target n=1 Tax=unclassified Saccharothrix TaxID=2593673 RepID=UPI00307DD947
MGGGDLVARPKDDTPAVTGIGLLESAGDLSKGVSDGDWVSAGLGGLGVGLEVLSLVVDPIGTLASYGVSWLIEHVQPLKEALDWLAGDPPVIRAFSETWGRVAAAVTAIAQDFSAEAAAGTAGWTGPAADAYRGHAAEVADALAAAGTLADGISAGVMLMGEVVAFVRETVREIVAELIGRLIAWALEAACTLGAATPVIVGQAVAAISRVVKRISDLIRRLVKTIANVAPRIRAVVAKLDEIIAKLAKLGRRPTRPDTPATPDPVHSGTTKPSGVDGSTSPSSATTTPSQAHDTPGSSPRKPDTPASDTTTPSGASPGTRTASAPGLHRHGQADDNRQPWPPERRDPQLEYTPYGELARTDRNIRRIMEKYGIRLDRGGRPRSDNSLRGADGWTEPRGRTRDMRIGPSAFANEEMLARTLYHENVHVRQINGNGGRGPGSMRQWDEWEKAAHAADRAWWQNHPLNPDRAGGGT